MCWFCPLPIHLPSHRPMLRAPIRLGACAALALTLAVIGCDTATDDPLNRPAAPSDATVRPADPDDPRLRAAVRVQNRHTPALMRREGVVGTATRLNEAGEPVVVIYTLSPEHARRAALPARLDDIGVEVEVTGLITALDANNPRTKERPAPNGFSVGHTDITAGTIGARVKDNQGRVYILSNNHVLANSNAARVGDAILQPGPADGGRSADQIGTLAAFEPISFSGSNTMDAALALVNGADLTGATPTSAYGAPGTSPRSPSLNLAVQKFGRTTGHTTGRIVATNVTISVCYEPRWPFGCNAAATFSGQFEVRASSGDFSAGGDSGSLIVTNDASKNPVGLLFAGGGASTFANPIGPVLNRFNVTIDPSSGGGDDGDGGDDGGTTDFSLSANGYKVRGVQHADLQWSGTSSTNVDVFRNGSRITTTANDGEYTDAIGGRGSGSYVYQVCEAGTSTCSNTTTVRF